MFVMERIEHAHIVELLGYGILVDGNYFIVMDFMEDGSLHKGSICVCLQNRKNSFSTL